MYLLCLSLPWYVILKRFILNKCFLDTISNYFFKLDLFYRKSFANIIFIIMVSLILLRYVIKYSWRRLWTSCDNVHIYSLPTITTISDEFLKDSRNVFITACIVLDLASAKLQLHNTVTDREGLINWTPSIILFFC